jgi:hypothetical protein
MKLNLKNHFRHIKNKFRHIMRIVLLQKSRILLSKRNYYVLWLRLVSCIIKPTYLCFKKTKLVPMIYINMRLYIPN